jgi:hypothetical protein
MSTTYRAIDWNRQKRLYDLALGGLLLLGFATFIVVSWLRSPNTTVETVILRGTAVTALLLLHIILAIGPLARLDPRFLPILYNRRHLGVTMFLRARSQRSLPSTPDALGNENPLAFYRHG